MNYLLTNIIQNVIIGSSSGAIQGKDIAPQKGVAVDIFPDYGTDPSNGQLSERMHKLYPSAVLAVNHYGWLQIFRAGPELAPPYAQLYHLLIDFFGLPDRGYQYEELDSSRHVVEADGTTWMSKGTGSLCYMGPDDEVGYYPE